jgi:hypothetical protein
MRMKRGLSLGARGRWVDTLGDTIPYLEISLLSTT